MVCPYPSLLPSLSHTKTPYGGSQEKGIPEHEHRTSLTLSGPSSADQHLLQPEEQISHLKRLLTSLGMKGQLTKAKAKVIKEKRELAAELGE